MTQANPTHKPSPAEARRATRDLVDFETKASARSGTHHVKIVNISPLGLMGRSNGQIVKGDKLLFDLPHVRTIEAVVRWAEDGRIGTEFSRPIEPDHYAMMLTFMPQRQVWS